MTRKKKMVIPYKRLAGFLSAFIILIGFNIFAALVGVKFIQKSSFVFSQLLNDTQQVLSAKNSKLVLGESTGISYQDSRVKTLEQFFIKHNSPLVPYADSFVAIADQYGLHYALLPAIAMVESNLCKRVIPDSYNCWGWGIYGGKVTRFASYQEGIETVARGLKKNYVDRGLDTPEKIMKSYNPANHNNWLGGVNFFLNILE